MDACIADEEPTDPFLAPAGCVTRVRARSFVDLEVVAFPTLIPADPEWDAGAVTRLERRPVIRRRASRTVAPTLLGAVLAHLLGLVSLVGAVASLTAIGAAAAALGQAPGGTEQLAAGVVNAARSTFPALIVPIERLEIGYQRSSYAVSLWRRGEPQERPSFVLPSERIGGTPDIPEGGAHAVPEVEFDPALLSVPFAFEPAVTGPEWMSVARPALNEAFPDDRALILRFDHTRSALRWWPGKIDPWPMVDHERVADAVPAPDRSGSVPMSLRDAPFVAFGGGFQSLHFAWFGARWNRHDIISLKQGLQTVAIYGDGHVEIGPWGTLTAGDIVEARQNLAPLVEDGRIPSDIVFLNRGTLTAGPTTVDGVSTFTDVHTWRSALGQRADGDLVYLLAARVTPQQLSAAMIRAGAVQAMQLDINAAWFASPTLCLPHPDDTEPDDIATLPLFTGLEDGGRRFVNGNASRDFFFVTDRATR